MFAVKSIAQEDFKDTTWYNSTWNICPVKSAASFYRVYQKTGTGFIVYDRFLKGNLQMTAEASAVTPTLIKNGKAVYYNENGTKSRKALYSENMATGIWIDYFDNEKDSSVYENIKNKPVSYLRRSALQKEEIFTIVEKQAEFPGGITGLTDFLQKNVKYPTAAWKSNLGGRVFLKFVITENGNVESTEILKGTGVEEIDNEALRVVNSMPQWKAATIDGRNVKVYFNLPISFAMPNPYFIFNTANKNENYVLAKDAILSKNLSGAMDHYYKDFGDVEAWYNMGVICYLRYDKEKSKTYFENVKRNVADASNSYRKASDLFLAKNFN